MATSTDTDGHAFSRPNKDYNWRKFWRVKKLSLLSPENTIVDQA
jgi:hypothetical protein